ncbi:MAG: iron ABC transporter permease [Parachlamydiaceae bacterium]|nr:iron ABC transporter permease [Parachlamydiaceae bacterium]
MKKQTSRFILISIFLLLICSLWTLVSGETSWGVVWNGVIQRLSGTSNQWNPLLDERLPRLIILICTGASLAVSGAIMQSLFHNPLASPSVLGISTGGSLLVVVIFIFNWNLNHPYLLSIAAVSGCFLTLCLVYSIARIQDRFQMAQLILTGIALSTIFLSLQEVLLYSMRHQWQLIQTITEWQAGSTINKNWQHVNMQLPLTLVGLLGALLYRKELNLLALGDEEAKNFGVDVERVRWHLFICVSLLTGGALAAVGIIAFFGLVLPHIIRSLQGPDHRTLIPFCILGGAIVMMLLDILLRSFSIYSLSIGNISAIFGGIFFLILLFRTQTNRVFS